MTDCPACDDQTAPTRGIALPLLPARTHGRSAIGCRYKCRDACSRPAPNPSDNPTFRGIAAAVVDRRQVLQSSAVLGLAGATAAACGTPTPAPGQGPDSAPAPPGMGFTAVAPNTLDVVTVPLSYTQDVVIRWGDPVVPGAPPFDPANQTAAAQAMQFGFNNDYLSLVAIPGDTSRALLVANHEYTNEPFMHARYNEDAPSREQIEIGFMAHGLSVVMLDRGPSGRLTPRVDPLNRRITARTPMQLTGPAAGDPLLRTSADPSGRAVLGTLFNCSGGLTPWSTILAGEENFDGYFANGAQVADPATKTALARYGMDQDASERKWETVDPRFELTREPNEPNRFGWIVEIDPFDPASTPRKRTALGRFKHEAANIRLSGAGVPVAYMGDDEKFEYMYKFVSSGTMRPGSAPADRQANGDLLDVGTLYVARFTGDSPDPTAFPSADGEFDGSGEWLPLAESMPGGTGRSFVPGMTAAQVLVNTRQAGDIVGATKMDRPEDVQPHPTTGRVYASLSNNDERGTPGKPGPDEANPRSVNKNGQVLEVTEEANDPTARRFGWKLLLVCGDPAAADTYYGGFRADQVSPISCPDNLAFDRSGNLWIATDGNALGSNDGLFAVALDGDRRGLVKQFLTVPTGAETCGPVIEDRTVLVSVQHPGESDDGSADNPGSHWPDGGTALARPAVVAVRRADGGPIGV